MAFGPKFGKELQRRLRHFGGGRLEKRLDWLEPYPIGLRVAATVAIGASAWSELATLAASVRRDATRDLTAMNAQQSEWATAWTDVQRVRAVLESTWRAPEDREGWEGARQGLLRDMAARGIGRQKLKVAIASFSRATADGLMKLVEDPISLVGRQLEAGVLGRLSGLAAADLGEAVARFNVLVARPHTLTRRPSASVGSVALRRASALLHGLHAGLQHGTRAGIVRKAQHAEAKAQQLLEPLVRAAAMHAIHQRATIDPDEGRRAIEVADAIRSALFVRSAARAIEWSAGWPEMSPLWGAWREAARTRSFESRFSTPPVTSHADVSNALGASRPTLVTVEGRVGTVKIVHRGKKAISSTSLTDASGSTVSVGLPYIKLDSGGMVEGCYARVTGTYWRAHDDFPGPVLVLDRRNLAHDARTSWLDWLAHELSPVVTPVAHHLTATWTWLPGPDGAVNPLQYATWSAPRREASR